MKIFRFVCVLFATILMACGGGGDGDGGGAQPPAGAESTVLAFNDLGMHCMDREFSVFSILPPFNVVHSQVLMRDSSGHPELMDDADIGVGYASVSDPSGSINTYSAGKTDFWQYADSLFGTTLQLGEGLTGLYMPGDDPQNRGVQPMEYSIARDWFSAEGIPITPRDDTLATNPYPLMRIIARDRQSGQQIGRLDVVVPVATETDCSNCHRTGAIAAVPPGPPWAADADAEVQSKKNILLLHDLEEGTDLWNSQPVLCARCHYSAALDLAGTGPAGDQVGRPTFSNVMHRYHGELVVPGTANPLFPPSAPVDATCYQCHPGKITQCQRGAMKTGDMDCNACHGDMLAVGGTFSLAAGGSIDGTNDGSPRRPWLDLPRCQACHTGDAVSYLKAADFFPEVVVLVPDPAWPFRLRQAYAIGDASASPLLALNKRFAEEANTLYRFSKGHSRVACEACHGSTHAIWPNAAAGANDNVAATQLQGHSGPVIECTACHGPESLPRTTGGPHGLHNVNDSAWYDDGHGDYYEKNKNGCRACHGLDLTGTPLAKTAAAREFVIEEGTVSYSRGTQVRCDRCHDMPDP